MTTTNAQAQAQAKAQTAKRQKTTMSTRGRSRAATASVTATPPDPAVSLSGAAKRPNCDPCDLACDAMPGFVIGDLNQPDSSWLLTHASRCGYCANMLTRYERVDEMLDRLHQFITETPPPPPGIHAPRASYAAIDSPVGLLFVAVTDKGVCEISFANRQTEAEFRRELEQRELWPVADQAAIQPVANQLREYFAGRRSQFEVPLDFFGVTPFTRSVLDATAEVPFGELRTYRQIAERVGSPRATRAVGNALNRNPIPVIIPCHRIVRSDATLGGYGGGVEIKQRLLSLEGASLV